MCKYCYEEFMERAGKIMLFCKLKNNEKLQIGKLCACQRFCSDENKYIPYHQKENCKNYK